MIFTAATLEQLKIELEIAFAQAPQQPGPVFSCATTAMPDPAAYVGCVLRNTTLNILAHSDGTDWIRQDTGAAI